MCLSKAYIEKNGEKEFLMTDIASVQIDSNKLIFKDLFGEKKEISGTIQEIDFTTSLMKINVSKGLPVV